MPPLPDASPTRRREPDDEWPPALVIMAGVSAFMGAVPAVLFALFVLMSGGSGLSALFHPVTALVVVVLPWLLVRGAVRLMTRRSRWQLISTGLPITALVTWLLLRDGQVWEILALLGPALAPVFALAPSVGRWLADRPFPST